MQITHLFFDLDGTLYSGDNGLWEQISTRMNHYMHQKLDIPLEEVPHIRQSYFQEYGTTLRGIQHHYQIHADEFLAFVHDVPLAQYLQPNPQLRMMLEQLSQPKWILTNSDHDHASRVLAALEIDDLFENIIDVWATNYHPKPEPIVFETALSLAGNPAPQNCLFIDDIPKNLIPAHKLGFTTVLVGKHKPEDGIDFHIPSILNLPQTVPGLSNSI